MGRGKASNQTKAATDSQDAKKVLLRKYRRTQRLSEARRRVMDEVTEQEEVGSLVDVSRRSQTRTQADAATLPTTNEGKEPKKKRRKTSKVIVEHDGASGEDVDDDDDDEEKEEGGDDYDGTAAATATAVDAQDDDEGDDEQPMSLQPAMHATNISEAELESFKEAALPTWLSRPIAIAPDIDDAVPLDAFQTRLATPVKSVLASMGIDRLFPVQATLLPLLLPEQTASAPPGDLLVSAPTGSGKTLAYVLPIVQALHVRVVVRLRALILLPTRELASQVAEVLLPFAVATGLKVATLTGQTSFAAEQKALVPQQSPLLAGGCSKVDIVIATPGRLVDHLTGTPNFTLQHLRYLIIDEADRLLNQSYHDWLVKVQDASNQTSRASSESTPLIGDHLLPHDAVSRRLDPRHPISTEPSDVPLQKLLFSATLTRNPSKLSALHLIRPRSIAVTGGKKGDTSDLSRFVFAASLKDTFIVCHDDQKPLVLIHLLHSTAQRCRSIICFAASLESTHRLFRLLQLHGHFSVAEFSSALKQHERTQMLNEFKAGRVRVLICSDGMARGMDVASVDAIISYDAPTRIQTHVHRVGRTARAGRSGEAFTVLAPREVKYFRAMVSKNDATHKLHRFKLTPQMLEPHVRGYERALDELRVAMLEEKYQKGPVPHIAYATVDPQLDEQDPTQKTTASQDSEGEDESGEGLVEEVNDDLNDDDPNDGFDDLREEENGGEAVDPGESSEDEEA